MERRTATRNKHRAQIARSQPPCAICGAPIDYTLPTRADDGSINQWSYVVDHINPLTHGGTDTLDNKQAAHWKCNRDKSDKLDGGTILRRSGSLATPGG